MSGVGYCIPPSYYRIAQGPFAGMYRVVTKFSGTSWVWTQSGNLIYFHGAGYWLVDERIASVGC